MVVETAYPFPLDDGTPAWENVLDTEAKLVPGYPATPTGQAAALRAVQDVVASAPSGRGLGVVYWEPAWTSVEGNGWDPADPSSGNAWENQAMFDLDGRLLAPVAAELAPDAATSVWSASVVYTAGDVVLHDGAAYVASWWTSGQEPGASAYGPWQEAAAADESGTSPWVATRVYVAGERATFDGSTFQARWWTRNQQPDGSAWGPWERVG